MGFKANQYSGKIKAQRDREKLRGSATSAAGVALDGRAVADLDPAAKMLSSIGSINPRAPKSKASAEPIASRAPKKKKRSKTYQPNDLGMSAPRKSILGV